MIAMKVSKHTRVLILICVSVFIWQSCKKNNEEDLRFDNPSNTISAEYYAGGATTTFNNSINAYRQPLANLHASSLSDHLAGDILFHSDFQPLGGGSNQGLGPLFIESSCGGCHVQNGRGAFVGSSTIGLLLRMSLPGNGPNNEPLPLPGYGTQLQTRAIDGAQKEGELGIEWEFIPVTFPDGYQVMLKQPYFSITNGYTDIPDFYLRGARLASPIYGVGLLEAISDETLLSLADENDLDNDGISGRPNIVWNKSTNSQSLGRFGWKSSNPSVLQQSADAFHQDMGITSSLFPLEVCTGQSNCLIGIQKSPDISEDQLNLIVFYLNTLAPPAPRNLEDPEVQRGKTLFTELKCVSCHTPEIQTGIHPISELSFQTIRPYSDLLLHELGPGLGDGRPDFEANANEWRTPPLWGIGLTKLIYPDAGFLHDGRAFTLEEAILWHEGEAFSSRQLYMELSASDRAALIKFLEAL